MINGECLEDDDILLEVFRGVEALQGIPLRTYLLELQKPPEFEVDASLRRSAFLNLPWQNIWLWIKRSFFWVGHIAAITGVLGYFGIKP